MNDTNDLEGLGRESLLLDRMANGDRKAFDDLYRLYFPAVYRNACMLLKDKIDAEDIVQETFLSLWQSRGRLADRESIGSWLFVTCHNRCINNLKRKQVTARALHAIRDRKEHTAYATVFEQRWALVEDGVAGLSARRRQAFFLCKLQRKTYEEAAGIMEISKNTVKEYLSGAMDSIRRFTREHTDMITFKSVILSVWYGAL
ncbi:MAG: sigma-70 family RNA polymerase sigma factor [Bacteroidetes bacterium]|nr:sigma-70 family RNA polymerase sigma factor [Bacteroidota bacterium]